ncbi:MAG: hypothetical protein IPO31_15450 [Candidatus Obscuribacter sp.]|nr:hypothetical protein [Candidatus Obscuribacter sp.]
MASDFREMFKPSLTERMAQDKLNTLDLMEKEQKAHPQPAAKPPEAPKEATTLLGKAVEFGWDKALGEAQTDKDKAARAAKSDQYAEIAADTIASVPKIGTLVGGISRATLLSDVSGNASAYDFSKKFALDLAQGAALNRVGKFAFGSAESAVVNGATIRAEMTTHFYGGAAFGGVKSAFNGDTYKDKDGNFSALAATQNLATGIGTGGLISMPAGYIGGRVGRASSLLLGNSAEQSLASSVLRSTITGSSNGFANGAVFGGVEAARHDFSFKSIMDGAIEGGAIGALTGGALSGADRLQAGRISTPKAAEVNGPKSVESSPPNAADITAKAVEVAPKTTTDKAVTTQPPEQLPFVEQFATPRLTIGPHRPSNVDQPMQPKRGVSDHGEPSKGVDGDSGIVPNRETSIKGDRQRRGKVTETTPEEHLYEWLYSDRAIERYEALSFKPFEKASISETAGKLKQLPNIEESRHVLPDGMSTKHEDIVQLLERIKTPGTEPDVVDFLRQMDFKPVSLRVYEVQGRETSITVPETYARQLDQVSTLRRDVELAQGETARAEATRKLDEHPLKDRALPEDIVQMLEHLPQSDLITRIELQGEPGLTDLHSRYKYNDPNFVAAARVGEDGQITLLQPEMNSALTTYVTHELTHLTRWSNKVNSRLFDKASSVDLVEANTNHTETRLARRIEPRADDVESQSIYHPSEHAARNLDEGWAVAKGEELMHPDADHMSFYARKAPVRALVLSKAMADGANHAIAHGDSPISRIILERARILDNGVRPTALNILQERLVNGSAQQRVDAADLIGTFGNSRAHGEVLLKTALDNSNSKLPEVDGKPLPDAISPRQAAVNAMVKLHSDNPAKSLDFAVQLAKEYPQLRAEAAVAIKRLNDPRVGFYRRLLEFDGQPEGVSDLFKHLPNVRGSDQAGRELMYKEMMGALSQNKSKQMEWSVNVFEKVPTLRHAVMDHLQSMVANGLNPTDRQRVGRYMQDVAGRVSGSEQDHARRVIDAVNRFNQLDGARRALSNDQSPESQLRAVEVLAAEPGLQSMVPLVELASSGRPEVDVAAMRALAKHSPNVIKHYVQEARQTHRNDPAKLERLNRLVNWRNYREAGIPEPGSN